MDMNEILNRWEKIQSEEKNTNKKKTQPQVSHKKANAPWIEKQFESEHKFIENEKSDEISKENVANQMEKWLSLYGTVDKDKIRDEEIKRETERDFNYLRKMNPEEKIDLHGLHQDEAYEKLNRFVTDCKNRGIKKILIVHGKGIHSKGSDPVLGELVRKFIENDKRLGMSGHPDRYDGGHGATWVIIR